MNFLTFDLNLLKVFDAVMEERSLTRAAQRLALTQSAVSHAVKRLREAAGEDWVQRTAHGVRPTARGEVVWPQVRSALQSLETALRAGPFDPKVNAVEFRLAMSDSTAALLMPPLAQSIGHERARVNLRVQPLVTRDPRELLERDAADVAVGHFPAVLASALAEGEQSGLRHQRLYTTQYVCVMRRGHPLAERELTLDAYCDAHHLLVSVGGRAQGPVDEALAALGRSRRVVVTVNQFFTAGRVVMASDLLAGLPASFLPATGYGDQLVIRPLPVALQQLHVEMVWPARRDTDAQHRWLRGQLVDAARTSAADEGAVGPAPG